MPPKRKTTKKAPAKKPSPKAVKKPRVKSKGGRYSDYKPEYAQQAYKLCLLGHTDEELAQFFGKTEQTINNWKKRFPEFFESVTRGKTLADAEVAESFHKRAKGYQYDEVTYEKVDVKIDGVESDDDIKTEIYKKKVVTKEVAPDGGAALNWLKNRQPKKWRDKVEHGYTDKQGEDINPITIFQLPDNGRTTHHTPPGGLSDEGAQLPG